MISRSWIAISSFLLLAVSGLLFGCAGIRSSDTSGDRPYLHARTGPLQFLLPRGWFNASHDARSPDEVIWLVKDNYTATISVIELNMDEEAGRVLRRDGLLRLAHLTMGLAAGGARATITRRPEIIRLKGRECCVYEAMVAPDYDVVRVMLVDTGDKVYEVRALAPKKEAPENVFEVQDEFVEVLRW